jgi:CRP-like cAMP-binding protein
MSETPNTLLAATRLFSGLSDHDLEAIYQNGTVVSLGAGKELIREGQENDYLHVVLNGQLEVSLPDKDDRFSKVRLGVLAPGDCIGEYSFFDHKPVSADVDTLTEVQLFKISQADLDRVLTAYPRIGSVLFKNMLTQLIERLRVKDAELDLFTPY